MRVGYLARQAVNVKRAQKLVSFFQKHQKHLRLKPSMSCDTVKLKLGRINNFV
jgi:hypothetical protein